MRILFIAPQVPWPLDTGGKIRTFHVMKGIAARHDVTLLAFETRGTGGSGATGDHGPIPDIVSEIEIVTRPDGPVTRLLGVGLGLVGGPPVTIRRYRVPAMAEKIHRIADRWAIGATHFDSLHTAQYREAAPGTPAVLDEHNVESVVWQRVAEHASNPLMRQLLRQQAKRVAQHESDRLEVMQRVLCCSTEDRDRLLELAPQQAAQGDPDPFRVIPNGVDLESFDGVEPADFPGTPMVFVGSMDWAPNSDGVVWFAREILPLIRQQIPDATFFAVGRNPPANVQELASIEGVSVSGAVPDVRPYVLGARVCPVPLRSGSGTRLKILEAFAARRPVVSTRIGAEGIAVTDEENLLLADDPEAFAAAVIRVVKDAELSGRLGEAGRALAEERYSWRAIGEQVAALYDEGL